MRGLAIAGAFTFALVLVLGDNLGLSFASNFQVLSFDSSVPDLRVLAVIGIGIFVLSSALDELHLRRLGQRVARIRDAPTTARDAALMETLNLAQLRFSKYVTSIGLALGLAATLVLTENFRSKLPLLLVAATIAFFFAWRVEVRHNHAVIALREYRRNIRVRNDGDWETIFSLQRKVRGWQTLKALNMAVFAIIILFASTQLPIRSLASSTPAYDETVLLALVGITILIITRLIHGNFVKFIELRSRHARLHIAGPLNDEET